jgi:hypothetical protein
MGEQLAARIIRSASKKFRNKLATNKSCLKSFWKRSAAQNHKYRQHVPLTRTINEKLKTMLWCVKSIKWKITMRKNIPGNCVRHSCKNPVQFTEKCFPVILPSRNFIYKRIIKGFTKQGTFAEPGRKNVTINT